MISDRGGAFAFSRVWSVLGTALSLTLYHSLHLVVFVDA